jgi:phage portal protein BeeE
MKNPFKGIFSKDVPDIKMERKSTTYNLPSGSFLEYAFGNGSYVTAAQAGSFYRNTASVATAVDMIADSIEQIEPVVMTEDEKFVKDHPVLDFLKKPNGFDRWHNFIGAVARNYLLKHDSLLTSAGNILRPPIEMWPVNLQDVSIVQAEDEYPRAYIVSSGPIKGEFVRQENLNDFRTRFYAGNLRELFHIRGYSSRTNKSQSDSPLQAAAQEARQIIRGKSHNLQLLSNGGRLSLLIAFKDEGSEGLIDDDEHKRRVERINEQYGGSNNAGKIGVISNADIDTVKEFGVTNKDMDYSLLEQMAAMAVYLRYKIPLPLVMNEASTFNNMETAIGLLYDHAVLPTADVVFAGITDFLFPRFNIDPLKERVTYNPESIEPLKKRRLEEIKTRKSIAVETTNELRSLLPNREPIENGDTLYQPVNLVPVGEDLFTDDNNST